MGFYDYNPDDEERQRGYQPDALDALVGGPDAYQAQAHDEVAQERGAAGGAGDDPSIFNRDTILATLLDMGMNRGRGIGQIVSATANNIEHDRQAKLAHQNRLEELQLHGQYGQSPEALALQRARIDAQLKAEAGKNARADAVNKRILGLNTPDSEIGQGAAAQAGNKAHAVAEGRAGVRYAHDDDEAARAALIAEKQAGAKQGVEFAGAPNATRIAADRAYQTHLANQRAEHEGADVANADAADKARKVRVATNYDEGGNPILTGSQQLQEGRRDELRAPIPRTYVQDDAAWRAATTTPGARGKVVEATAGFGMVEDALGDMERLRKQYGAELFKSKGMGEYEAAQKRAVSGWTQIGHSGVLSENEWKRYADMMPGMTPSKDDALSALLGRDVVLEQIQGVRQGSRSAIASGLRPYGIAYDFDGSHAPRAQAPAPAASMGMGAQRSVGGGFDPTKGTDTLKVTGKPNKRYADHDPLETLRKLQEEDDDIGATYGR